MNRRKISPLSAIIAVASVLALTTATLASAGPQQAAVPANPTQAQALDAVQTLENFVRTHPDAPVPTTPPATTTPPPTTTRPPVTATTDPSPSPSTDAPVTGLPSGMPWASGVNPQSQHRTNVAAFESMRGKPVDYIVIHPARDNWTALNAAWAYTDPIPANYKGRLSYAMPLWPGNGNVTTNYNAEWTAWANRVEALDPKADVRLGWEMNLPWTSWRLTSANQAQWVAAFNRAASAINTAAPGFTITFNPNWGNDQTGADSRAAFQQVKANVDVFGIDYYDAWPAVMSDAIATSRMNQARSLNDSYNYAVANGKKFALPEWGLGCTTSGCQWAGNAGGDNPRFVNHVMNWLKSKPANTIAYEAYFDEPASYIKGSLRAGTVNPNGAAAYRVQITALAH